MYSDLTHIVCPVCGKSTFLQNFAPENMASNLYVQYARGLGRGKGFTHYSESILHSPEYRQVRERLAARIITVLGLLAETGTISNEQIIQGLGLNDVIEAPLADLETKNEQQADKISELERQKAESEAALAQSVEEKKEIEDELSRAEIEVGSMLRHAGLSSRDYRGLTAKLEALNDVSRSAVPRID